MLFEELSLIRALKRKKCQEKKQSLRHFSTDTFFSMQRLKYDPFKLLQCTKPPFLYAKCVFPRREKFLPFLQDIFFKF